MNRFRFALCVCAVALGAALLGIAQEQIATAADLVQSSADFDAARILTFDPAAVLNEENLFGIDSSEFPDESRMELVDPAGFDSVMNVPQESSADPRGVPEAPPALPALNPDGSPAATQENAPGWPNTTAQTTLAGYVANPPSYGHWVGVNLSAQKATAYFGSTPIKTVWTSTGTRAHPTVVGTFRVWTKLRSTRMQGGSRYRGDYYNLAGVPYVQYFYRGYAVHGTYWHRNFGRRMSHGCVNLTIADSAFFYNWGFVGMAVRVHY